MGSRRIFPTGIKTDPSWSEPLDAIRRRTHRNNERIPDTMGRREDRTAPQDLPRTRVTRTSTRLYTHFRYTTCLRRVDRLPMTMRQKFPGIDRGILSQVVGLGRVTSLKVASCILVSWRP